MCHYLMTYYMQCQHTRFALGPWCPFRGSEYLCAPDTVFRETDDEPCPACRLSSPSRLKKLRKYTALYHEAVDRKRLAEWNRLRAEEMRGKPHLYPEEQVRRVEAGDPRAGADGERSRGRVGMPTLDAIRIEGYGVAIEMQRRAVMEREKGARRARREADDRDRIKAEGGWDWTDPVRMTEAAKIEWNLGMGKFKLIVMGRLLLSDAGLPVTDSRCWDSIQKRQVLKKKKKEKKGEDDGEGKGGAKNSPTSPVVALATTENLVHRARPKLVEIKPPSPTRREKDEAENETQAVTIPARQRSRQQRRTNSRARPRSKLDDQRKPHRRASATTSSISSSSSNNSGGGGIKKLRSGAPTPRQTRRREKRRVTKALAGFTWHHVVADIIHEVDNEDVADWVEVAVPRTNRNMIDGSEVMSGTDMTHSAVAAEFHDTEDDDAGELIDVRSKTEEEVNFELEEAEMSWNKVHSWNFTENSQVVKMDILEELWSEVKQGRITVAGGR